MTNKRILFWGAGASANLNIPTTLQQSNLLSDYFFSKNEKQFIGKSDRFLSEHQAKLLFSMKLEEDMQKEYSIKKLNEYVNSFFEKHSFTMQNLFESLDAQIYDCKTLMSGNKYFTAQDAFIMRRGMLVLLQSIFSDVISTAQEGNVSQKYVDFFKIAAVGILEDKIHQIQSGMDITTKDFMFSDISYISTNWDVSFLWSMFIAHMELNDQNGCWCCYKGKNTKLKIFNDFSTYMAAKYIDGNDDKKLWYPYSAPVATRVNDADHIADRIVTLIRTYLPHGQTNWLECPVCKKLNMYLGDEWNLNSPTLAMQNPQSKSYKCLHCGNDNLTTADASMLMQSLHKVKPPYIQEIQTDMKLRIQQADTIIFVGYSLPQDDIEYRTIFTQSGKKKIYVVLYEENAGTEWYKASEIKANKQDNKDTIKRFTDLFGEKNVKVTFAGFPEADKLILKTLKGEKKE